MRAFLRGDVEVHERGPGSLVIDRAVERSFRFSPPETVVVRALAGERFVEVAEAGAAVRAAGFDVPDEAVARFMVALRELALLGRPSIARLRRLKRIRGLVFDPPAAVVEGQLRFEPSPAGARIEMLPDTAFSCQATGGCCRRFLLGPLTDADVEKMERYRFPDGVDLAVGAEGYVEVGVPESAAGKPGARTRFLRMTGAGRCVYLGDDNLCDVHRYLGGDQKPLVCRLFPFKPVRSGDEVRVSLSSECGGFEGTGKFPAAAAAGSVYAEEIRGLLVEAGEVLTVPARVMMRGEEIAREELEKVDAGVVAGLVGKGKDELGEKIASAVATYCRNREQGTGNREQETGNRELGIPRKVRELLQDLRLAAVEGARGERMLAVTKHAYRRVQAAIERGEVRLEDEAAAAIARVMADAIFGKQHLRAPDTALGVASLGIFAALAARDASRLARERGLPAARHLEALAALRDLAPAFEAAAGIRAVVMVRLLESGFASAPGLVRALLA